MTSTDPGEILVLRVGVAHALRWLVFAIIGLISISSIFVAASRSNTRMAHPSGSSLFDMAILGLVFTGLLGILLFQVAVLCNQRVRVDNSELRVTDIFGRSNRFPRGLIDRVEQYRQISYAFSRFGTTVLLTRAVCTDGRAADGLRISVHNARRFADSLGVRFVSAPSIWKTLVDG